jgi:biopolymer transport protein ExbB
MEHLIWIWEIAETGGPVMLPIVMVSVWMWILIILKADWILRIRRNSLSVMQALEFLESKEDRLPRTDCPKAGILAFFLDRHFKECSVMTGKPDRLFFEVAVRRQTRTLYRFIPTIMVLAAAAPLLGLLGTVTGMVETFRVIGAFGMGNAQAMASGIKEAMITTQAGLLVAIPGLLAGQIMRRRVRAIHQDVLIFQRAVTQWLEKEWRKCTE